MSRSTELARLAVRRHEHTGMLLEESIARAIRQALEEQGSVDQVAALPRGQADALALAQAHGRLTPEMVMRHRGITETGARRLMLRMLRAGIFKRRRRGVYELAKQWRENAIDSVAKCKRARIAAGRAAAAITNARRSA